MIHVRSTQYAASSARAGLGALENTPVEVHLAPPSLAGEKMQKHLGLCDDFLQNLSRLVTGLREALSGRLLHVG